MALTKKAKSDFVENYANTLNFIICEIIKYARDSLEVGTETLTFTDNSTGYVIAYHLPLSLDQCIPEEIEATYEMVDSIISILEVVKDKFKQAEVYKNEIKRQEELLQRTLASLSTEQIQLIRNGVNYHW